MMQSVLLFLAGLTKVVTLAAVTTPFAFTASSSRGTNASGRRQSREESHRLSRLLLVKPDGTLPEVIPPLLRH